jgi:hypothetical protein
MVTSKCYGHTFDGPKHSRPRCGALRVDGGRCRAQGLKPSGRCFRHGGLSTGPRSADGKERQRRAAQDTMLRVWRERRSGERPMPKITDERRASMRARLKERLALARATKEEAQRKQRWEDLTTQWRDRRQRENLARKAAARARHAERMRWRRAAVRGDG